MNYIGSKKSLLPFLEFYILKMVNNISITLIDLFAGTVVVGQHLKNISYNVLSNDIQYYSYVLNKNYIENNFILNFIGLENELTK